MEHHRDAGHVRPDRRVHVRSRAPGSACRRRWMGRIDAFWIDLFAGQRFLGGADDAVARSATWTASDGNCGSDDRNERDTARPVAGCRYWPGADDSCPRSPVARRWADARDAAWTQRGFWVSGGAILVESAGAVP